MAGGRGILDANGRLLIRSDGTVDVCEECCAAYSRWRKCGSLTGEIYTRDGDSAPNPFKRISDGLCWSRVSTGNALPLGATLLDPADWTTDAGCCVCSPCDDPRTTTTARVTFSGISLAGACLPRGAAWWQFSGSYTGPAFNDTFDFDMTLCDDNLSLGTVTSGNFTNYSDGACSSSTGSGALLGSELEARFFFDSSGGHLSLQFKPTGTAFLIFEALDFTAPSNLCYGSYVISNDLASGGTATVTWV